MISTPLGRFRIIAFIEGLSYIALIFIAMPLKYFADIPMAVRIVGSAHGALFVLYILTGVMAAIDREWSVPFGIWAFVASLIPFGTFYLDKQLKEQAEQAESSA